MKEVTRETYEARNANGSCQMCFHSIPKNVEEVEKEIDAHNERVIGRGFPAEQYIIIRKEVHEWRLDDGMFFKRETFEQMCEVYPKL